MTKKFLRTLVYILIIDSLSALALTIVLRALLRALGAPSPGPFGESYAYTLAWVGIYSGSLYVQHKYDG